MSRLPIKLSLTPEPTTHLRPVLRSAPQHPQGPQHEAHILPHEAPRSHPGFLSCLLPSPGYVGLLPKPSRACVMSPSSQMLIVAGCPLTRVSGVFYLPPGFTPPPFLHTVAKIVFLKCTSERHHPLTWGPCEPTGPGASDWGLCPAFLALSGSGQPLRVSGPSAWPAQTPARLLRPAL